MTSTCVRRAGAEDGRCGGWQTRFEVVPYEGDACSRSRSRSLSVGVVEADSAGTFYQLPKVAARSREPTVSLLYARADVVSLS